MKVVVIDYKIGNISSIQNMLKKLGVNAIHSGKIDDIKSADRLILPGVGAFDHGMQGLHNAGLITELNQAVLERKTPLLGICLGMQLLLEGSAEGVKPGLGWIKGRCQRFSFDKNNSILKIPHMGWNVVTNVGNKNLIPSDSEQRFYFVHSYHPICENQNVIATTNYGYDFPSVIGDAHILGAQFHPEKSHKFGMNFLRNFIEKHTC